MEAHITEWLNLLVRWIHFIVGVHGLGHHSISTGLKII